MYVYIYMYVYVYMRILYVSTCVYINIGGGVVYRVPIKVPSGFTRRFYDGVQGLYEGVRVCSDYS